MKRLSLLGFVGMLASVLAGCPVFSGDGQGNQGGVGGAPEGGCVQPTDCPQNETCGSDGMCHSGDCAFTPCVAGYTCTIDPTSKTASCTPSGAGTGGSGGAGAGGSGTGGKGGSTSTSSSSTSTSTSSGTGGDGGAPVYCGHPGDCPTGQICGAGGKCEPGPCSTTNACIYGYTCSANGTCTAPSANACDKDSDCASLGAGYLCITGPTGGGVCTAPSDQCFDQSQCDPGDSCVAGKCVTSCSSNSNCRDGYTCDTTHGVCTTPVQTCTITNDCGSASKVCVGGTCVPRSSGGTCPTGDVWDENGCIPNQAATFTCTVDGTQDVCATGSICLHHDCWISCDAATMTPCTNQPTLNTCKPVVSSTTTYNVCGTATNLGSDCGAGAGNKTCSGGKICIDGFCK